MLLFITGNARLLILSVIPVSPMAIYSQRDELAFGISAGGYHSGHEQKLVLLKGTLNDDIVNHFLSSSRGSRFESSYKTETHMNRGVTNKRIKTGTEISQGVFPSPN